VLGYQTKGSAYLNNIAGKVECMQFDFSNKTVILTGALGSIGTAISFRFLQAGANVVVSDIQAGPSHERSEQLLPFAGQYIYVQCDISSMTQCEELCAAAIARFGRVDILINNAGINTGADQRVNIGEYDQDIWKRIIDVNLNGVYYCSSPVIKQMLKQGGGRIVNIGSVAGHVPLRLQSAYAVAKSGIHHMTKTMALELAEQGIYVNAVLPGSIMNDQTRTLFYQNEQKNASLMAHIPMHRPGTPEEIATAVMFLSDDDASYINGSLLIVDGGWTCGYARDW